MTFSSKTKGLPFTDKEVKAAAVVHYDHHYGTGAWKNLTPRAQRRLVFRMRAALSTLRARK